ncbi:MAG: 2Fe-2S iron-sulfur cluster binding domain-containing protein, partial [Chloroflexi bacterium]|nr:2Fe-2S iron-sulfur cluster binding domain-containing protein [Chloroflexota bacterium]
MSDLVNVKLTVNDELVQAEVRPDMSLMEFIREYLGLTGTKNGCDSGHCGACTVILDGKARRACLVRMSKVDGGRVETVESLSSDGSLHPLQYAFVEKGAVQCGFCTPGILMTSKALLDVNPEPTDEDIKKALTTNRNLCRCTGYVNIIEAVHAAAEMIAAGESPGKPEPEGDQVRSTLLSSDAIGRVTGATKYGDDLRLEGMLYGKILWAEHPHAEILGIDNAEAEAMDGVAAVITARDIPGKNQAGLIIRDQPAIAADKVR